MANPTQTRELVERATNAKKLTTQPAPRPAPAPAPAPAPIFRPAPPPIAPAAPTPILFPSVPPMVAPQIAPSISQPTGSRTDPMNTGAGFSIDGKYYPDAASRSAANQAFLAKRAALEAQGISTPAIRPVVSQPVINTPAIVASTQPSPPAIPSPETVIANAAAGGDPVATVTATNAPTKSSGGTIAIGAGAGFLVAGPIGALVGAAIAGFLNRK